MNIEELKAAIDRRRAGYIPGELIFTILRDAERIADTLTDTTPIHPTTPEKMTPLGFAYNGVEWSHNVGDQGIVIRGDSFIHRNGNHGWAIEPKPRTLGDLRYLLLRLGREQK